MSSKKNKTKKTQSEIQFNNVIKYVYLLMMFIVYPLIMHRRYFDITITRYYCFMFSTIGLIVFSLLYFIIKTVLNEDENDFVEDKSIKRFMRPEFWALAFGVANVFAWIVTEKKIEALTGSEGRYMGMFTYVLLIAMYFIMSRPLKPAVSIYYIFMAVTVFMYILSIFQHAGIDAFGLKKGISKKQYNLFISTMGNINIYASYIVIAVAVFATIFVFTDKLVMRILAGIIIVLSLMSSLICNSDSVYLGIAAVVVFIAFVAIYYGRIKWLALIPLLMTAGNLIMAMINKFAIDDYYKREGLSRVMENIMLATVAVIIAIVIAVVLWLVDSKMHDKLLEHNKMLVIVFAGMLVAASAVVILIAKLKNMSIMRFDYKWGNYRGFIWSKCVNAYMGFGPVNKIFGYGNETIKDCVSMPAYDEMMNTTHRLYDNAHNELIQYLLTTGIMGLISYLGMVVTSFLYMLKNSKGNMYVLLSLAVLCGYFSQSLININQPITTPFCFLFMAIGIGYARYINSPERGNSN